MIAVRYKLVMGFYSIFDLVQNPIPTGIKIPMIVSNDLPTEVSNHERDVCRQLDEVRKQRYGMKLIGRACGAD